MVAVSPVILCGGMGTRLWPLSREDRPKQFNALAGDSTLLQQTVNRLAPLGVEKPVIVCNRSHVQLVREQLAAIQVEAQIIVEPEGRNTAPAVAAAAHYVVRQKQADQVMLVLPADHIITQSDAFEAAVAGAVTAAASGYLVTFGVVPTNPETGYGYVKRGPREQGFFRVAQFVEKPNLATAERYAASGDYFWNSGMFAFMAGSYLDELERFQPSMVSQTGMAVAEGTSRGDCLELEERSFTGCPSDSIDYAVMEKTDKAALVPLDAGWSDVGSWSAVAEIGAADAAGNTLHGDVVLYDSRNSHFHSSGRLLAGVGVDDLIVVETPDAVLVVRRDRAQDVKGLVDRLREQARSELVIPVDGEDDSAADK